MSQTLKRKFLSRKAYVAVIGLGYVGLPLAVKFAKADFRVSGMDKDRDRVNSILRRKSYIHDVSHAELKRVVDRGLLSVSTSFEDLSSADAILICVPTPLKRKYTPDIKYILNAVQVISQSLKKNSLVVLESTTYPGTTEELIKPVLEQSGLKAGRDFHLSFSPERIDPGNKKYDVTTIPKVIGGLTTLCGQ